jgi:hypothetical protein
MTARENKLVSNNLITELDYEKLLEEQERLRLRQIELEKMRMLQISKNGDQNGAANIVITSRGTVAQQENLDKLSNINLTIYVKNDEFNNNKNGMRMHTNNGGTLRNGVITENYADSYSSYDNGGAQLTFKEFQNNLKKNRTHILRQINDKYYSPSLDDIINTYSLNNGNLTKMIAATKIQSYYRGYRDRKLLYQRYKDLYE